MKTEIIEKLTAIAQSYVDYRYIAESGNLPKVPDKFAGLFSAVTTAAETVRKMQLEDAAQCAKDELAKLTGAAQIAEIVLGRDETCGLLIDLLGQGDVEKMDIWDLSNSSASLDNSKRLYAKNSRRQ